MLDQMNTMFIHFGGMSEDMKLITGSVVNMGGNIEGIPVIAGSMKQMNTDVAGMSQSVWTMKQNVSQMDEKNRCYQARYIGDGWKVW